MKYTISCTGRLVFRRGRAGGGRNCRLNFPSPFLRLRTKRSRQTSSSVCVFSTGGQARTRPPLVIGSLSLSFSGAQVSVRWLINGEGLSFRPPRRAHRLVKRRRFFSGQSVSRKRGTGRGDKVIALGREGKRYKPQSMFLFLPLQGDHRWLEGGSSWCGG